jgi:hypothetical protein
MSSAGKGKQLQDSCEKGGENYVFKASPMPDFKKVNHLIEH